MQPCQANARRVSYCRFVNKPLLFITTNQRSPKVVDPAAQKMYWRSTRPFFSPPPHKKKKSGLGTRLQYHYAPEKPIEPIYSFCCIWRRKNMVVTAVAERCMGWLTCVTTTNCSVLPASNYTVAT